MSKVSRKVNRISHNAGHTKQVNGDIFFNNKRYSLNTPTIIQEMFLLNIYDIQ